MMQIDPPSVIIDDEPFLEREDRPRSRTWPILPPPIETIHEHERDAEIAEPPPIIEEDEPEEESSETQKTETGNTRKNSRKNAWGNLSYADLITQAIQSSAEQRLTLSQIYEWMVRNIPYFKDKGDSTSSAGWKNSIRHNLSLHSRFMRVQNDNNGKSSYWVINPDAKPGKSSRRRSGSVDGQPKGDKKRIRNKKLHQSTDDISALSPNALKLKHNRSYDNLFAGSPCSSTDSLSTMEDFHGSELSFPYSGESFNRPRSRSNVSTQSSVNGRATPPLTDELPPFEDGQSVGLGVVDDIGSMSIENQGNVATTINLNDSMKYTGSNENTLPLRRPHSDSFGSGDSGYESPALLASPQGQVGNVQMNKVPSPNLVPNKPPPPYSTGFHNQMRQQQQQQQSLYNQNFYPQGVNQQQTRFNMMNNQAPRLKHLPIPRQNSFPAQKPSLNGFNERMVNRTFQNALQHNNMFDNYIPSLANGNMVAPNITVENKMNPYHQQLQHSSVKNEILYNDDIPMDLHQLPLFDFDDQKQLASDLDAIIKVEMTEANTFKSICEPYKNDTNNNSNKYISTFPGQHWVR